ncbi:MAG: bifunctional proline dehydrogenase/L-glutamate gamma-semialdehyde dehydrogenase PutA [Alphaproteobacteria bacterium]|nr:bifunctional proline dehydrogenase/L-glutamate gamma-semialdehyde dehydrogenase PutA [Alphaproteobacteria bacterium]
MPHLQHDALHEQLLADEAECVEGLLAGLPWDGERSARVHEGAVDLIRAVRAKPRKAGELEVYLQEYGLSTKEGQALMGLAEALLRTPDAATADALIRDRLGQIDWKDERKKRSFVVQASRLGLALSRGTLDSVLGRLGEPVVQAVMKRAMRVMGTQFVLGRTPEEAIKNARRLTKKGYRMSYDMLGEGARTAADAKRYFDSYCGATGDIGRNAMDPVNRPTISVKLSALHPRFEFSQDDRCAPLLIERLSYICHRAAEQNIGVTIDAEESYRLELTLQVLEGVVADPSLVGWDRFGMAVQAYHKRAIPLIERLIGLSRQYRRFIDVRLVKGAYWDTEIKRAQVLGLDEYPVYTRKANTDLSYLACAHRLLESRGFLYPMFATHNAHTVMAVLELAGDDRSRFEFQRLHGMGETLHDLVMERFEVPASVYAPVGAHEDLLAYLVRRLLENGANSSFVNRLFDDRFSADELARDPVEDARAHEQHRHPKIPLPRFMYGMHRINSRGIELADGVAVKELMQAVSKARKPSEAAPLIAGRAYREGVPQPVRNPARWRENIGGVWYAGSSHIEQAFRRSKMGFREWRRTSAEERAAALEKFADLLEENRALFIGLCVREGGKTIPDSLAEVREAADFCRYYAALGRKDFSRAGTILPGPTGEKNVYTLHGRGTFVCISPWNFPLAIFTGQIGAALMAGNAVIAKPAEQTSLVAMAAVQLMHRAGVPKDVLHLLPGDGRVGAAIVAHPRVAGVAFTGSTEVARAINLALAEKGGPIVPLIAETGGQNAMIVDSSALIERVIDDVLVSAFGSAGQRCSALRILLVQREIADRTIEMLKGAMRELRLGDPMHISTDVGPVIDEEAYAGLMAHFRNLEGFGELIARAPLPEDLQAQGHYFAPCAWELKDLEGLRHEVFGPVLHVMRYDRRHLDEMIDEINAKGYGLTFGMHTRIDSAWKHATTRMRAGNCYINRSMTGAVVGVQPFGGHGLSGTGPKAGGPHYLHRFATERVISIDTTASGGNASLVSLEE